MTRKSYKHNQGKDIIISLSWANIHYNVNKKWKKEKKTYKLGKVNDRIPVLWLARSKSKKIKMKLRYELRKKVLHQDAGLGSRLDWKIVETF